MDIVYTLPTASEYVDLRVKSGIGGGAKKIKNAEIALKGSLFTVSIRENDKLIGFGRVVGDGAVTYVVSDIMVDSNFQGRGIGRIIMSEINKYFEENTDDDAYITLIAVKPADKLYSKFNFNYAEPNSSGMIRSKN